MPDDARPGVPPAEVTDLRRLADYAEGSIVSRTLIKGEAGTVTLFAFDAGQSLSEHTAPFDALVQVLHGQARITIDAQLHDVRESQSILLPANVPHAVNAECRFKMLLTMIRK